MDSWHVGLLIIMLLSLTYIIVHLKKMRMANEIVLGLARALVLYRKINRSPQKNAELIRIYERLVNRYPSDFEDIEDYALLLTYLGIAYRDLLTGDRAGNIQRAIGYYQEALRIYAPQTNPLEYATTLIYLSNAYLSLPTGDQIANVKQAITCCEKALRYLVPERAPDEYAQAQGSLGVAYFKLLIGDRSANNVMRAIGCYQEALRFHTPKTNPLEYARIQRNRGLAYLHLSRDDDDPASYLRQAITCFQEALRFHTPKAAPLEYAAGQNMLGTAYLALPTSDRASDLGQAIACFQEALRFRTPETAPLEYALTQRSLGEAYLALSTSDRLADVARAITCYQEALHFLKPDTSPLQCLLAASGLGDIYFNQKLWQDALNTYRVAIAAEGLIYRSSLSSANKEFDLILSEKLYRNAAFATVRCGKITDALLLLEQGKTRLLIEALRLRIRRPTHIPDEVWEAFEHAGAAVRAVLLNSESAIRASARRIEPIVWETETEAQANLAQTFTSHVQGVQAAHKALDAAIKHVRVYAPDFLQEIDLSVVQSLLPGKDTALLAFCITEQGSMGLVVDQNHYQVVEVPTFTRTDLVHLFKVWSKEYKHYQDDHTSDTLNAWQMTIESTLALLGQRLLSPVLSTLPPDIKHIILIPSAELFLLPLHATPLSGNHTELLCDRYQISYAASMGVLADARAKVMKEMVPEFYAIINPEADTQLVFTSMEGAAIAKLFAQCEVDKGRIATKRRVFTRIRGKTYVHFACHGNYDWNDPKESGLNLADGRLTLANLQQGAVDLSATRLVTLSACETGMTDVSKGSAEEYVGIPAGFMLSGVPGVISSLWTVPNLSTALLMERFYHNHLVDKMDFAAALQEAQGWVRGLSVETVAEYAAQYYQQSNQRDKIWFTCMRHYQYLARENPAQHPFEHPYYWAAFTMNGW